MYFSSDLFPVNTSCCIQNSHMHIT